MGNERPSGEKLIATNSSKGGYTLHESVEAGLVLTGTEIKSIRSQSPNLKDSYVEISNRGGALEAWLVNTHIAPYANGNVWNHEPLRRRKILLHRHQIKKLFGSITQDGMTVIPTRMYFKMGMVKIEVAIAKNRKAHDKRQAIKEKSAEREIAKAMKHSHRKK